MTIKKILRVKITTGTFSAGRKGDSSTGYKPHITGNIQADVMLFHGGSGTRFGHPVPCAGSGLGGEVPQSARLWRRPGPRDALPPCAPLPVLLPHVQQLLHAVVHGFGELADSITLLFSVGKKTRGGCVPDFTTQRPDSVSCKRRKVQRGQGSSQQA